MLLSALRAAGSQLRYHGDFDWPGLQIAAPIIAAGARPWRMGAQDYLSAIRGAHQNLPRLPALDGGAASPWDDRLVIDMHREGRQLEEEHVINDLLADLQVAGTRDCRFNAPDENPG